MSTLRLPSKGRVTNPYSATHRGIDFGWGNGKEVYAAAAGNISYESAAGGYGKRLTINHGKLVGKDSRTRYAHLSRAVVTSGEVTKGQLIGYMGNTGYFAVFVHLHFELEVNFGAGFAKVNPTQYFTDSAGGGGTPITPSKPKRKKVTIYYYTDNDKSAANGGKPLEYALAGESPGTSANWIATTSASLKAEWSIVHGAGVFLTKASYDSFKSRYLESLAVTGAASGGYNGPTTAQIAQAVNDDAAKRLAN